MRPGQCLVVRGATPERIDHLVAAGALEPGDAVEVKRYLAYLCDIRGGTGRAEAYAKHYPEDRAAISDGPGNEERK